MVSSDVDPDQEASPEESRLVCQARAGDAAAFIQLYDVYVEGVYRHVYLQVLNSVAAEKLTSRSSVMPGKTLIVIRKVAHLFPHGCTESQEIRSWDITRPA